MRFFLLNHEQEASLTKLMPHTHSSHLLDENSKGQLVFRYFPSKYYKYSFQFYTAQTLVHVGLHFLKLLLLRSRGIIGYSVCADRAYSHTPNDYVPHANGN